MNYPLFHVPGIGGGMLIALVAIFHVVIAHFTVGMGIYLAWTETLARRRGDVVLLAFLRRCSATVLTVSLVAGAVSGVGIWFAIGLASPEATSLLIHVFVWAWAIEWLFFIVEIAAAYLYHYTWERVSPARHLAIAWIYAISAWASLFIITGILCFMLTPGRWPETQSVADGFFNPTFWPSVWLRTISSLALAGIFAMILANLQWPAPAEGGGVRDRLFGGTLFDREQIRHIVRHSAWFLALIVGMVPLAGWWFARLPAHSIQYATGGAIAMVLFLVFGAVASALLTLYALFGLLRARQTVHLWSALMLLGLAVIATGAMEFVREGVRKPYLVSGVLYANEIPVAAGEDINREGFFARDARGVFRYARFVAWGADPARMSPAERGRLIFRAQCAACHHETINALGPLMRTWSREAVEAFLPRMHEYKPFMPPFFGTPQDRADLAAYLMEEIVRGADGADTASPGGVP